MTTLDRDGVTVAACGIQAQSSRLSQPVYGISKVSREQREKMFLSQEHSRAGSLCRESPIGGAIYNLPSTLDTKAMSFTKGASTDFLNGRPDLGVDSNAELVILPDSQQFKYGRDLTMIIGTDPRGKLKDAELIKNHASAFFGRASPGPASIGDAGGPKFEITKPRMAMARPFGVKLKSNLFQQSSQPDNVGPGIYPRSDDCFSHQYLSHRKNQAVNGFSHAPKFPPTRSADSVSLLDAAKSSVGKQALSKNRSEPTIGFGVGTRDRRGKTALCMTEADKGPKAFMPKQQMSMPRLPPERDVMQAGWSCVGAS